MHKIATNQRTYIQKYGHFLVWVTTVGVLKAGEREVKLVEREKLSGSNRDLNPGHSYQLRYMYWALMAEKCRYYPKELVQTQ